MNQSIDEPSRRDDALANENNKAIPPSTPTAPSEKPLAGTQTERNLMTAAAGEAQAQTKYELYSGAAYEEGLATVGDILWDLAHQEREHAEIWYDYLGKVGTTAQNLDAAMTSERYESESMYPEFARVAQEEGFDEIAEKFRLVGGIEAGHSDILKNMATELADGTLYGKGPANARWFCTNCGYIHEGTDAPERCPVCAYGKGYFLRYDV